MPRRRKVRGIGQAFRDTGNILMQHAMGRMNVEHQNRLVGERQRELAGLNATNRILDELLKSPQALARLQARGVNQFGGMDLSPFFPSEQEGFGGLAKTINAEVDPSKLPLQGLIAERLTGGVPGLNPKDPTHVEGVMNLARAQNENIMSDPTNRIKREFIDPEGIKREALVRPDNPLMDEVLPMERTGAQEGLRAGETELAKITTPGLTQAQIDQFNTTDRGTRAARAASAGAIQAAQTANSANFQTYDAADGTYVFDRASGEFRRAEGVSPQGSALRSANESRSKALQSMVSEFRTLSERLNTGRGLTQKARGGLNRIMGATGYNDDVEIFQRLRRSMGVMLAVVQQGSRPTDRDAIVFEDLIPHLTTNKEAARRLLANFERLAGKVEAATGMSIDQIIALDPETRVPGWNGMSWDELMIELGVTSSETGDQPVSAADKLNQLRSGEGAY